MSKRKTTVQAHTAIAMLCTLATVNPQKSTRKIQHQIMGTSKLWDTLLQLRAPNAHPGSILTMRQKIWFGTILLHTLDSISRNPSEQRSATCAIQQIRIVVPGLQESYSNCSLLA